MTDNNVLLKPDEIITPLQIIDRKSMDGLAVCAKCKEGSTVPNWTIYTSIERFRAAVTSIHHHVSFTLDEMMKANETGYNTFGDFILGTYK